MLLSTVTPVLAILVRIRFPLALRFEYSLVPVGRLERGAGVECIHVAPALRGPQSGVVPVFQFLVGLGIVSEAVEPVAPVVPTVVLYLGKGAEAADPAPSLDLLRHAPEGVVDVLRLGDLDGMAVQFEPQREYNDWVFTDPRARHGLTQGYSSLSA